MRKLSRLRRAKAWLNSSSSSSTTALAPVALAPVALVPVARRAYRRRARRRSRRRSRGHRRRRRRRRRQKRREEYSRSITTRLGSAHRQFNMQQCPMHDLPVFLVYSTLDYNKNAPKGRGARASACLWALAVKPYRSAHTASTGRRAARPRDSRHPSDRRRRPARYKVRVKSVKGKRNERARMQEFARARRARTFTYDTTLYIL